MFIATLAQAKEANIQFVTRRVLADHMNIGERLFMRMVDEGKMPKGIKMGDNKVVYDVDEFESALARLKEDDRVD